MAFHTSMKDRWIVGRKVRSWSFIGEAPYEVQSDMLPVDGHPLRSRECRRVGELKVRSGATVQWVEGK